MWGMGIQPADAGRVVMLVALVLICAVGAPCDPATARAVIPLPVESALPARCLLEAMEHVAGTAVRPGPGEQMRVSCARKR